MRIKNAPALVALALALAAAACGESGDVERIATVPPASTAPQDAVANGRRGARGARDTRDASGAGDRAGSAAQGCEGILSPPFNEGACVNRRTRYVIANGRSELRLRTLTAFLQEFSVVEQLARATPQQGVFVIIKLRVTNRTNRPARFAAAQTLLNIAGEQFQERTDVEERHHPQALAFADRRPIPPGGAVEGVVIYDLATAQIERVTRQGELFVVNFDGNPRGRQPEFGQFRIYRE